MENSCLKRRTCPMWKQFGEVSVISSGETWTKHSLPVDTDNVSECIMTGNNMRYKENCDLFAQ